jgi:hypothetical protein
VGLGNCNFYNGQSDQLHDMNILLKGIKKTVNSEMGGSKNID